jgi:endonuclease YncB( thermonuclease family)
VSKPIPKEPTYLVTTESGRSIPAVEVIPLEDAYEIVGVTGGRTKFAKKLVKSVDLVADKKVPAKKKTGAIPSEAKVARVVDGDTIELEGGELVRLIGIDTPETVHPNKPVEWFGKEASAYTRRELEGKTVKIVVDQGNAAIKHRDKYGRVLAYIDVDGKDFNAQIVKEGYAHAYTQFPFERMKDYALYEHEARESKSGLWGEKGPPEAKPATPPKAKRAKAKPRAPPPEEDNESEDTSGSFLVPQRAAGGGYWITISSGVRHNSGCRWYHNSNGRECGPSEGRACKICGG